MTTAILRKPGMDAIAFPQNFTFHFRVDSRR